jgi:hypothetical protein
MRVNSDHHRRHLWLLTTITEKKGPAAGTPDSGSEAPTPLTSHTTARPRQAGASLESQTTKRPAADIRAKPAGASQRYGLTSFHPGQTRNAYRKHNQADTSAPAADQSPVTMP